MMSFPEREPTSADGACGYLNLPPEVASMTTVESKTNFPRVALGPHRGDRDTV